MTTRAELRTSLRHRLEDSGLSPLWPDELLNDAIAGGIRQLSAVAPAERRLSLTLAAGTLTVIPVATDLIGQRIVRVFDPKGEQIPHARDVPVEGVSTSGRAQAWRWWKDTLTFSMPALGGTWQIEYVTARAIPTNDTMALDLVPGDEEVVVALALAVALRRRAIEDGKRGSLRGMERLADRAEAAAERLLQHYRRRAVGGWLGH